MESLTVLHDCSSRRGRREIFWLSCFQDDLNLNNNNHISSSGTAFVGSPVDLLGQGGPGIGVSPAGEARGSGSTAAGEVAVAAAAVGGPAGAGRGAGAGTAAEEGKAAAAAAAADNSPAGEAGGRTAAGAEAVERGAGERKSGCGEQTAGPGVGAVAAVAVEAGAGKTAGVGQPALRDVSWSQKIQTAWAWNNPLLIRWWRPCCCQGDQLQRAKMVSKKSERIGPQNAYPCQRLRGRAWFPSFPSPPWLHKGNTKKTNSQRRALKREARE